MKHLLSSVAMTGLLLASLPTAVLADTRCTTYIPNQINCTDTSSNTELIELALLQAQLEFEARMANPAPAPIPQPIATNPPGLDLVLNGKLTHLPQGMFVKAQDELAIYAVRDQKLGVFVSWGRYLQCGGLADLSNVLIVTAIPTALVGYLEASC